MARQTIDVCILAPDGQSWRVPLGAELTIGSSRSNELVLDRGGVSASHCSIHRDPNGALRVEDRGSTNGTWIDQCPVEGLTELPLGATLQVGAYTLRLEQAPASPASRPTSTPAPIGLVARGPLLRLSEDQAEVERLTGRVRRYAQDWDQAGRPRTLLLRGSNLARAVELDALADGEAWTDLEREFVDASVHGRLVRRRWSRLALGAVAAGLVMVMVMVVVVAGVGVAGHEPSADSNPSHATPVAEPDRPQTEALAQLDHREPQADRAWALTRQQVTHTVIPAETLAEIARRYDVPLDSLMRWNGIDETTALVPGQSLELHASTIPLPQQMIVYRPTQRESWSSLARRFDVPVAKLRAYNPELDAEPGPGASLTVWIDPKPLVRKTKVQIPEFEVRPNAISVGGPRNGRLIDAIQFPADEALYKRRAPNIMWCSSHMAKHLRQAIASFRYTYEFEGELVVADMSREHGGQFDPHQSHQAGRDVDIWLPTLKGVYQPHHIRKIRRPNPEEADWFALYGFLQALHRTGEVQQVFLAYELQDRVYKAAKLMGASDEELDAMIAYPRGPHFRGSLLQHSSGHIHHVHVRFKCGPNDECDNSVDDTPGD